MEMDQFLEACDKSCEYPKNVIQHDVLKHNLRSYFRRLEKQAKRLFVIENAANLDFLDLNNRVSRAAFRPACVQNLGDLKEQLREAFRSGNSEPMCRFIFMHARHSRTPLNISYQMFCFLFSYLQVPPAFLDFVFPFGSQEQPLDFYFTGFRAEVLLQGTQRGLQLPELGRSGKEMRLCFNLRSVEESPREADLPWSIRQLAIYHSFDFETGKAVWITIKGNKEMKKRISELVENWSFSTLHSVSAAFTATLRVYLLLCDWSVENWRWYINDLESALPAPFHGALSTIVDRPATPPAPTLTPFIPLSTPASPRSYGGSFPDPSRRGTISSVRTPSQKQRTFSIGSWPTRVQSDISRTPTVIEHSGHEKSWTPLQTTIKEKVSLFLSSLLPYKRWRKPSDSSSSSSEKLTDTSNAWNTPESQPFPPGMSDDEEFESGAEIKFSDLQRIQYIEDKAQQTSLVLQLNIEVVEGLCQHYTTLDLPSELGASCSTDIDNFKRCVGGAVKDLRLQRSRAETLLRLLAERKKFLYAILQYQSMRSSEKFAMKAHESAKNMESLTNNMNDIAQKTKQETVSMRIITLVTLFFLPGTFIGTFMSTDIVKFETNEVQHFQWKGLKLFLAICIPMMIMTFAAWGIVYQCVNRKQAEKNSVAESDGYSNKV